MTTNDINTQDGIDYTDSDTLRELYYDRGLTLMEIADMTDTSTSTIRYWMDKYGMERRSIREFQRVEYASYCMEGTGYMSWSCNWNEDQELVKVHRLLAVSEHGLDAVDGMHVHHKNEVPWDNRPNNIELKSPEDHHSGHSTGENHAMTDLTESDVKEILRLIQDSDMAQTEIADEYGITDGAVSNIKHGYTWEHVQRE